METVFDLPTHTLLIHVPVVLVPLVCAAVIAMAVRPAWRRRYGWVVLGATAVILVATLLAYASGEAFDELLDGAVDVDRHADLAATTRLLVFGLFLAVAGLVVFGWWSDRQQASNSGGGDSGSGSGSGKALVARAGAISSTLAVVTVALAVLSTVWLVRTGHEGAKVTWGPTVEQFKG